MMSMFQMFNYSRQSRSTDGRDNKVEFDASGVFLPFETLYKAPKQGTQYFWYDTNTNKIGSGE